jgi:ribosomal protein S18 acetylase RimI-like enzyme
MPLNPIRRLTAPVAPSLYHETSREALSCGWSPRETEKTEREHPELIVRRGACVLAALAGGGLAYAFENERDFVEHFPAMLEALLPKLRRALQAETVRFRLLHNPSRPLVEPVLKRLWFAPARSWLQFSLARKSPLPKLALPKGVNIREGGVADVDDLIRIDRESFPDTPLPSEVLRSRIASGDERVLVATAGAEVAGFAMYERLDDETGYLGIVAVAEAYRERGIGAALTLRVAKALFAEGVERVDLKTDDDNSAAIRLYTRLGFRQTAAGRDYARPTDPRAITQLKKTAAGGTMIRFGGWR